MAGVNHRAEHAHDYGVDGQFAPVVNRDGRRVTSGYPLDFQAKATINWELMAGQIVYDLEVKAYNDMVGREPSETTLMLICCAFRKCRLNGMRRRIRRTLGDASTLDRRVAQVRVVDPRHPLYGHCYPVSDRRSGRGPALIVIQLPDGRERAIPRSATAVASASDDPATTAGRLAHISVRTLLPLANHVRAVLASRHADLEAGGERHLEQATAAHGGVAGSAATPVAAAADRDTTSPGTTDRPACATSAPRVRARRGG